MGQDKPYEGLKGVDASLGFAAPYRAGLLAFYGADIFRSEPLEGDWAHNMARISPDKRRRISSETVASGVFL